MPFERFKPLILACAGSLQGTEAAGSMVVWIGALQKAVGKAIEIPGSKRYLTLTRLSRERVWLVIIGSIALKGIELFIARSTVIAVRNRAERWPSN